MRVTGILATAMVVVVALIGLAATPVGAQGSGSPGAADWPSFLFDTGHSSYNAAATSIDAGNLAGLQPIWKWTEPIATYSDFDASPTVVNGVVYIGSESGYFYAISEATQTVLWSRFLGLTPNAECGGSQGITGTAAVADDPVTGPTVYVNAADGQLYALAAATGATLWQSTVDTPSSTLDDYYAWGSPMVANGNIYIGVSSSCDFPLVPGGVLEFDQDTGAPSGAWHALPNGLIGASVWSSVAESTLGDGSVFADTGNANTKAQPLYNESIVRLSGSGLSLLDSWELPQPQIADSDFGGSPTVFTADLNGTETPMVGVCNKNGNYYAFSQSDLHGGPVWQDQIAAAFGSQPNPGGQCDAAALWDGTNLIESGGNATVINGVTYQGSVQSLNPATGTPIWQTGLPGSLIGSPTEDGAGIVAAQVYSSATGNLGVYLLSADSGAILGYINTSPSGVFAQPVFAGDQLLIAGTSAIGLTAYGVTTQGPPASTLSPQFIGQGANATVNLEGSGFTGTPQVLVSGTYVTTSSVVVNTSTSLQVKISVSSKAAPGPRDITIIEPGQVADTCSACLTIDSAPTVSSASPITVPVGETARITVNGNNFHSGTTLSSGIGVKFSGTTVVSPTQLTTTVAVSPTATPGKDWLGVKNPDGGSGGCTCFTVAPDPAPTLSSVAPASVGQHGIDTLTITGTDFTTNSKLSFSSAGVTMTSLHFENPTSITATVSVSSAATPGSGSLTVTTSGGSATCQGCLAINPHPAITKLNPAKVANGSTSVVVVSGSNFASGLTAITTIPGAVVGTPINVTPNSFSVSVSVASGVASGSYLLEVTNPDNGTGYATIKVS